MRLQAGASVGASCSGRSRASAAGTTTDGCDGQHDPHSPPLARFHISQLPWDANVRHRASHQAPAAGGSCRQLHPPFIPPQGAHLSPRLRARLRSRSQAATGGHRARPHAASFFCFDREGAFGETICWGHPTGLKYAGWRTTRLSRLGEQSMAVMGRDTDASRPHILSQPGQLLGINKSRLVACKTTRIPE